MYTKRQPPIIDRKEYDFTANKESCEPLRAEDYVLPAFTIKESKAKGAEAKLRTKLSKVLAFIDLVKYKRFKTGWQRLEMLLLKLKVESFMVVIFSMSSLVFIL